LFSLLNNNLKRVYNYEESKSLKQKIFKVLDLN
jgi:hypothetical protein